MVRQGGLDTDEGNVFDDRKIHVAAPLVVYTLLAGDNLGNGFERANLGDVGAFDRDGGEIHVLLPLTFTYANAVVSLDWTRIERIWELSRRATEPHRVLREPNEPSTSRTF
mgnify:CR=1 FL=1